MNQRPPGDAVQAVMIDKKGRVLGARTNNGEWLGEADAAKAYRDTIKAGLRVVPMVASEPTKQELDRLDEGA